MEPRPSTQLRAALSLPKGRVFRPGVVFGMEVEAFLS